MAAPDPSVRGQSLDDFLAALASADPTPGGGAGAGAALGMAAALVAMTARLTCGRRKFRAVEADMQRVIARCDAIRTDALRLAAADAAAYGGVMRAYALPRATAQERGRRRAAIASAAAAACRVPLRVAARAAETIRLAAETAAAGNPTVVSDAGAGATLARAAIRICEMNVHANLGAIDDAAQRDDLLGQLADALHARDAADAVVDAVLERGAA